MRKKEEEKKRKEEIERAQEEFGLTHGGSGKGESLKSKDQVYSNVDLKGMEVEHDLSNFTDGKTEILVFKDKEILDEDQEDVLMSYDIQQVEKGKKFQEDVKKGREGYQAYEDGEPDEHGFFKQKEVLGKYDEEIEGEKKGKFRIGAGGRVNLTWEEQREQMKRELRAKGISLESGSKKVASDYLTTKEIKFKKKGKKKRKIRKKNFKADDLLPLTDDKQDHGSRASRMEVDDVKVENDAIIDDAEEANRELEKALAKTRREKIKKEAKQETLEEQRKREVELLAEQIKQEKEEEEINVDEGNYVTMNTTEEFCKKFQYNQTTKPQENDEESEEEIVQDDVTKADEEDYDVTTRKLTKKQMKYDVIMGREREKKKKEESHVALEEEPR